MKPYQKRVVDEKSELDEKISKLSSFLSTAIYEELPEDEKDRLGRQVRAMIAYSTVLSERINAFE